MGGHREVHVTALMHRPTRCGAGHGVVVRRRGSGGFDGSPCRRAICTPHCGDGQRAR
jgi:hypothetical protein